MNWKKIREEYPVTKKFIYMNTGWCGPRSLRVQKRIDEVFRIEIKQGVANPELLKLREDTRNFIRKKTAQLLNADEEEIALTDNTSNGINIIAASIAWREKDEIIISDEEHPAGIVPWLHLKNLFGIRVKVVKIGNDEDAFIKRFKKSLTSNTKLVCLSHVSCMTGFRIPVERISKIIKGTKALLLADGAQSAGQIEVDVKKIGCDIYSIPGQKWLMGPEGTGGLYVKRELIDKLKCLNAGYRSIKALNFEKGEITLHDSAKRFEIADKNTALLAGFGEAIDFLSGIGIKRIEKRIKKLSLRLIHSLKEIPWAEILSPNKNNVWHSGLVSITIKDKPASELVGILCREKKIICRYFPSRNIIRFSVNFFNTAEEIQKVTKAVKEFGI